MNTRGDSIGPWILDEPLGRGGFAEVWRVHTERGQVGALKVLLEAATPFAKRMSQEHRTEQRARLRREARALSELDHPNVVGLIEVVDAETLAVVTTLVEGPNLAEWMAVGPRSAEVIQGVFAGILDGVEAAHAAGWVHRDLKPSNVLMELCEPPRPKIADFGLAYLSEATRLTRSGLVMGTPSYMAPEQVRDPSKVEPTADLFALGAILFELWCDRPAFRSPDMAATLQQASSGLYPDPMLLRPDMPEPVAAAIAGALEPDPTKRIPDCATLREILAGTEIWDRPVRPSAPTTLVLPPERSWLPGIVGGLLGLSVVAGIAAMGWSSQPTPWVPDVSENPAVQAQFGSAWEDWRQARLAPAAAAINAVAEVEPGKVWVHLLTGLIEVAQRHEDDALASIARAAARLPSDPTSADTTAPVLIDALLLDFRGTDAGIWTTLADAWPDDPAVQAVACVQLGKGPAAERACRRAAALQDFPLLHYLRARDRLIAGDLDSADDHLRSLLVPHPDHARGLALRADWLGAKGRWDEAVALADRAVALAPGLADAHIARGTARVDAGDLDGAAEDFADLHARYPWSIRVLAASSEAQVRLGVGEVTRPLEILELVSAESEAEGRWGDVVYVQTRLGWLGWYLRDAEALVRTGQALKRAQDAAEPGSPEAKELEAHRAYLAGLEATVRADGAGVTAARQHLQRLDVGLVATIDRETAIDVLWAYELALSGDLDRLLHVATRWEFCEAQASGGQILQTYRRHEAAVERYEMALKICSYTGFERFFRFLAAQGLAEDAVRRVDPEAEAGFRAQMAVLWPRPEVGHARVLGR